MTSTKTIVYIVQIVWIPVAIAIAVQIARERERWIYAYTRPRSFTIPAHTCTCHPGAADPLALGLKTSAIKSSVLQLDLWRAYACTTRPGGTGVPDACAQTMG